MIEKLARFGSYLLVAGLCCVPYLLLDSVVWAALLTVPTFFVAPLVAEHLYNYVLRKSKP